MRAAGAGDTASVRRAGTVGPWPRAASASRRRFSFSTSGTPLTWHGLVPLPATGADTSVRARKGRARLLDLSVPTSPPLPHLATGTYLPPSPRRLCCEPVTVTGPARRRASAMHTRRELGGSARPDSTPTWLPPARARPSPSPPVRIPSPLRPRRHYARKTQCHDLARLCRDRIAMETPTSFSLFRRVGGPTPTRTFSAH